MLGYFLRYFRNDTNVTYDEALLYAIGIMILNFLNALCSNHILLLSYHNGMKVRVAVCSLIYRKSLRLSQTALGETSPGKVVNLLSNDVNRFDWASFFFNSLWISPLLTFIVGCLLWKEARYAGLVGISVVFMIVPILSYAGKLTSEYRLQTALRTDERVRFMDEIISGVQVIKIYAWEKPFAKLITFARQMEMKIIRKTSYIRAFHMTFMLFTTRMALFSSMLTIALVYGPKEITAAKVYVISSYFGIVAHMMSQRFSRSVAECAEVLVALRRLEKFLSLDEKKTFIENGDEYENGYGNGINGIVNGSFPHESQDPIESSVVKNSNVALSMKNMSARWVMPSNEIYSPKKNSVYSGKNLHSNEIIEKGNKNVHDTVPDLHVTIKLSPTLENLNIDFPKGKLTGVIGPVGAGKSSLLQAILRELPLESGTININGSISYACQEPWVFAASVRQNILFGEEYNRERYNTVVRTCALEKDFEQFENGDRTIVGERGASLSGGQKARINLARACYRNADIYLLDDPLSAVDAHVGTHIFNKCIGPASSLSRQRSTRILVTHQVHFLKAANWLIVLKNGRIEAQGTPAELARSGVDFVELVGTVETPEVRDNSEMFKRQKSQTLSIRSTSMESLNSFIEYKENEQDKNDEGAHAEQSSKGKVKGSVFINYFTAGANWFILLFLCTSFLFVQLLGSAADYFVSIWTKQEEARTFRTANQNNDTESTPSYDYPSFTLTTELCIYIHATLVVSVFIIGISRSIGFYTMCLRCSQNIHNAMFKGIISTSMRFFDTNPSGRILNRFSRDIGSVDEFLPKAMLDTIQSILSMVGSITLAASVNAYFLIPVFILSIIFYLIKKIYLKTSKNVKRLEGIAKSPAFTHLSATLSGLSTVRAYKVEKILAKEFDNHQDMHSACWYMAISTSAVFGFSLDILCLIFTASIIFYYMLIDTSVSGEKIGLAVTQAIGLTGMVQWGVRQSAEVSNQMMSVERLLEYRDLEPEKQPKKAALIAKSWPSKGSIEFRNVFYRYSAEAEPVLRGLSFVINPMEKIGIVGRTGAGKSSLIGSLFRLACIEGQIQIDGVDTANIQLSDLRKQIAIIPQDPVLFSGTLRRNLDPFEEYSDDDIWSALESVELKSSVSENLGLQSTVLPHGANYSVGQRQLLCLARAILRKNRILVLDEATANVDPQTDLLIQRTIREKFTECTVLTVAHRIHTIIDSDRVLIMASGKAVEFDEPHNLLQNQNGIFYGMVKALGPKEFDRLSQAALEKFNVEHCDNIHSTSL
ncbi:ATP-binding cassette subfamily C member 4-like isoform X2 [Sitodiplosis mosellana]|nr:ATP-binding cassette subfamily C member 4-like isoform X2 [Sitodiplosis mosellana]